VLRPAALPAQVLMNIGLLSVTASVYQMMRGAEMLFAAVFAVLFLRRALNRWAALLGLGQRCWSGWPWRCRRSRLPAACCLLPAACERRPCS
jgi:hypothetical protein